MTARRTARRSAAVALACASLTGAALAGAPAPAFASGPPAAATAFTTAVIGPDGGTISGFGITADFKRGAVTSPRLIILGNWPNGLDVPTPAGTHAVKTFGIQECNTDGTACTSELGNFQAKQVTLDGGSTESVPASPAGTQKVMGQTYEYEAGQPLPDGHGNTNFGTAKKAVATSTTPATPGKLVTITTRTGADTVLLYNANAVSTKAAYMPLPSTAGVGSIAFDTFQPVVWTLTVKN